MARAGYLREYTNPTLDLLVDADDNAYVLGHPFDIYPGVFDAHVRGLAEELWVARGRPRSRPEDRIADWLIAERALIRKYGHPNVTVSHPHMMRRLVADGFRRRADGVAQIAALGYHRAVETLAYSMWLGCGMLPNTAHHDWATAETTVRLVMSRQVPSAWARAAYAISGQFMGTTQREIAHRLWEVRGAVDDNDLEERIDWEIAGELAGGYPIDRRPGPALASNIVAEVVRWMHPGDRLVLLRSAVVRWPAVLPEVLGAARWPVDAVNELWATLWHVVHPNRPERALEAYRRAVGIRPFTTRMETVHADVRRELGFTVSGDRPPVERAAALYRRLALPDAETIRKRHKFILLAKLEEFEHNAEWPRDAGERFRQACRACAPQ